MQQYKLLKCINKLTAIGSYSTAFNMTLAFKDTIIVSEEYMSKISVLPHHYITLMVDKYKEAIHEIAEASYSGFNKDEILINIDKKFREDTEIVLSMLKDSVEIVNILVKECSAMYDKILSELPKEEKTVFEKSIEQTVEATTTVATNISEETIKSINAYINKLSPEKRLAIIYAMGFSKYYQSTEASVDTEESICFGIYSVDNITEKALLALSTHDYKSEDYEFDILFDIVENVSSKTVEEVSKEISDKTGFAFVDISSLEGLVDQMDSLSEQITEATGFDIIITIVDNKVSMMVISTKAQVSEASALTKEQQEKYDLIKSIVEEKTAKKVDGYLLDLTTASMLLKVIDGLKESVRNKFLNESISKMAQIAWKVTSSGNKEIDVAESSIIDNNRIYFDSFGGGIEIYISKHDQIIGLNGFSHGTVDYISNKPFENVKEEQSNIIEKLKVIFDKMDKEIEELMLKYELKV